MNIKVDKGMKSFKLQKEPTGFTDPDEVIVTGDNASRTVTLTGTVNAYYIGRKISEITSGWTSRAHGTNTSTAYFLLYDGTTIEWKDIATLDVNTFFQELLIAISFYDSTNTTWVYQRECHGLEQWQSHRSEHRLEGTYRQSGGGLSDYTLSSTTAAERRPSVAETQIFDEDLETINPSLASEGPYTQFYLTSTGIASFVRTQDDIVPLSGSRPYYNEFTGGSWQQTLISNNYYMSIWLGVIPVASDANSQNLRYVWFQGQEQSSTLLGEQARSVNDVSLGNFVNLTPEFVFTNQIIIRYQGGDWTIQDVVALTGSRSSQSSSPAGNYLTAVASDSTLTGLGTSSSALGIDLANPNTWTGAQDFNAGINIPEGDAYKIDNVDFIKSDGTFEIQIGRGAGTSNTGANISQIGYNSGNGNSGISQTAFGYYSGYGNSGTYQTAFGSGAGYQNSGNYQLAMGYNSGNYNVGGANSSVGYLSGFHNQGVNNSGFGAQSGRQTIGDAGTFIGVSSGAYNQGDYNTAFGVNSFPESLDSGSAITFDNTDIDASTEQITLTAHGLGSIGERLNMRFTQGTSQIYGWSGGDTILFEIIDANTVEAISLLIINAGSGTGHTLTPFNIYNNSSAVGYAATPDASNQVVLGDTNVTEVKTSGQGVFGQSGQSTIGGGVIINNGGADSDSQIKGNTDDNLIYVDASTDRVGIGTSTPSAKLEVDGEARLTADTDMGSDDASLVVKSYVDEGHVFYNELWAEENAALATATYEWAYGNGANTPSTGGQTKYVPSGYTCTLVAMTLTIGGGTATVEAVINGTPQGSNANVSVSSGTTNTNDSFTPVSISNGDLVNFRTQTASGTSGPCVATMIFKFVSDA